MAQTKKRLDDLEKALGVNLDELAITTIEIWCTGEDGEKRLLETWDLRTGEVVKHDQEDRQTIE